MRSKRLKFGLIAALLIAAFSAAASAAPLKLGVVRSMGGGPSIIAKEKGFFAAEGIDVELVFFDSAAPIAVAVASGDIDFGITGMTAAFFNLAGGGTLKIIGAGTWDNPGFHSVGFLVSNQAYAAGLHTYADIGGHSVGITQLGTQLQYFVTLLAEKYSVDPKTIRVLALQSNANVASALAGGQVDLGVQTVASIEAITKRGDARLLGWLSDVISKHMGEAVFTTTKTANDKGDAVRHFLAGLRRGERYFHDAFADANDQRRDGPNANEVLEITAHALNQPITALEHSLPFFDPEGRISLKDIATPMAWYRSQGMLKGDFDAKSLVDMRYVIEIPNP